MTPLAPKEQELFKILRSLPPVKVTNGQVVTTHSPCAACGTKTFIGDFKIYDSKVLPAVVSPICHTCELNFKDQARLVCCRCRSIIGWVDPHKDGDGFVFEKRNFYHIQACPVCSPGIEKSDIIEKVLYLKKVKNKII